VGRITPAPDVLPLVAMSPTESVVGIILAGGASSRLGVDKLWEDLGGRPVLAWSIAAMIESPLINRLVVVVRPHIADRVEQLLSAATIPSQVVAGGTERQDSVRAGLVASQRCAWVVVHDGARPFLTPDMIERGLVTAQQTGSAIAAVPLVDTVKVVEEDRIVATPDRRALWAAQTPQVFRRDILQAAHDEATAAATDDAALVEAFGRPVRVFMGAYGNIKITTSVDLQVARVLASQLIEVAHEERGAAWEDEASAEPERKLP